MIINKIYEKITYINNKIQNSLCEFVTKNDKKNNIHEINIINKQNNSILQTYNFKNQKSMLEFLENYETIDNYIILINDKFPKKEVE